MKNSADQGGCYSQMPKAEVDNTLRDLQNSSYPTKSKFNIFFIIHSKYFPLPGLEIATNTVANATNFSSLATKIIV